MRAYNRRLKKSVTNVERLRARKGARKISLIIKSVLFKGCLLMVTTKVKDGAIVDKVKYFEVGSNV